MSGLLISASLISVSVYSTNRSSFQESHFAGKEWKIYSLKVYVIGGKDVFKSFNSDFHPITTVPYTRPASGCAKPSGEFKTLGLAYHSPDPDRSQHVLAFLAIRVHDPIKTTFPSLERTFNHGPTKNIVQYFYWIIVIHY